MKCPGLHVNGSHTDTFTINHHQIKRKVFDEEVAIVLLRVSNEIPTVCQNIPSKTAHRVYEAMHGLYDLQHKQSETLDHLSHN
jgi:hypothetical protein